ncbi:MAG: VWA domain-containing protein [Proteobacteria bacterium]|nr:VWA domain-containing protein [Pseudomonadota bacterium]
MPNYFSDIIFANYSAFWLLLPAAILSLLPLLTKRRGLISSILRLTALSLLVISLARPIKNSESEAKDLYAAIDTSASISSEVIKEYAKLLKNYSSSGSQIHSWTFAQNLSSEFSIDSSDSESAIEAKIIKSSKELVSSETNLDKAINTLNQKSTISSLLLLSDGMENIGDASVAAKLTGEKGIKIFPLIIDENYFKNKNVYISSLYVPLTAQSNDSIEIRTALKNNSNEDKETQVEIFLDQEKLLSQSITVEAEREKLLTPKTPILKGGLHEIKAFLKDKNGKVISETHKWVSVKERERILLLSGSNDDEKLLKNLITYKGYNLEAVVSENGSAKIPTAFEDYNSIIINNVANRELPANFLNQLELFVKNGGGLLLIGGSKSYGLGGYIDTKLEEISPLKFVPPQTEKKRQSNAIALLIDKSGSMAEDNKIYSAKLATLSAIETLKDQDYFGLIGFDAGPFVIIDVKKVAEVKQEAERRLRNLTAAGKTNLLPALVMARQRLSKAENTKKHIIVVSDGKFPLSSNEYVEEINSLRKDNISVTTVALGLDADVPFMKMLAKAGSGAFYYTLNAAELPNIFVEDIKVSTGEKTLHESEEYAVARGPAEIKSTSIVSFPDLKGFIETLPKKGSNLELITRKEDRVYPILASWKYGAGKVIAYTSDANGRWSQIWTRWKDFFKFWTEIIEEIKDKSSNKAADVDFDLKYFVDKRSLIFDLAIFDEKLKSNSNANITAELIDDNGSSEKIEFKQEKLGKYKAKLDSVKATDYKINLTYGNVKLPQLAFNITADSLKEFQGQGLNVSLLEKIAFLSKGKINPGIEEILQVKKSIAEEEVSILPLLILAFMLILIEALLRERYNL